MNDERRHSASLNGPVPTGCSMMRSPYISTTSRATAPSTDESVKLELNRGSDLPSLIWSV
jgi:hypothetical protein